MATGLPVVTTRHGGIPEAVEHEVGGLLCNEGDADGIAAAVERLIGDPALYSRLSAGGAEAARARFSREAIGADLRALYDRVSGDRG
jgi:colanic acid/amylovoran biosynthesis glycosyltransferase